MAKLHRISIGEETFRARSGQVLLDAALVQGVEMPHDCRAGRCGSCLTRVRAGITMGGQTRQPGMIHACQAMVFSDLELELEPLPPVVSTRGKVVRITEMAEDIVEVVIEPSSTLDLLRGQYCRFRFRGYPDRPFSPTASMLATGDGDLIHLHIKRVRGGRVTPHLGGAIKAGHSVVVDGPRGHAFLRPGASNRLVLVGSGTGFAPIWAVAAAALHENAERPVVLIAASRKLAAFYMSPALDLATRYPNVTAIACVEELTRPHGDISNGRTIDHVPALRPDDTVYAAGAPGLVEAVGTAAEAAGAAFYADPFEPTSPRQPTWMERAKAWVEAV